MNITNNMSTSNCQNNCTEFWKPIKFLFMDLSISISNKENHHSIKTNLSVHQNPQKWWCVANLKIHLCTLSPHPPWAVHSLLDVLIVVCCNWEKPQHALEKANNMESYTYIINICRAEERRVKCSKELFRWWYPFSWLSCLVCDQSEGSPWLSKLMNFLTSSKGGGMRQGHVYCIFLYIYLG